MGSSALRTLPQPPLKLRPNNLVIILAVAAVKGRMIGDGLFAEYANDDDE
jgi:hypothetical protein